MLHIRDIQTFYGPIQGLFGLSLKIRKGEMVALLGRNGMGKTTTVRSIMGLTPPRTGTITFQGTAIHTLPPHRIARLGIGLVPENRQIFPTLTLKENLVATAAQRNGDGPGWQLEDIFRLFPLLEDRQHHFGNQLSGGEQQMTAIGRALMTNPRFLILDEATEGLAPRIRQQIWQTLALLKQKGLTVLVIDKNVDALAEVCDRFMIVEKGRITWEGLPAALIADDLLRERHLGV